MSAIGPGDWVECVAVRDRGLRHPLGYRLGELCLVSQCGEIFGIPWINCQGKALPSDYGINCPGWALTAFRPIYRPKASFIASLKAPPEGVKTPEFVGANSRQAA